jgi:hypothetical protein
MGIAFLQGLFEKDRLTVLTMMTFQILQVSLLAER